MKWQKAIPSGKEANHILFGEGSPSLESLEQLREKTLRNDAITSHLWRDGGLKLPKSERTSYRTTLLTERGCMAICYPWWGYRNEPKICALYAGRSLFVLYPVGGSPEKPHYRLICDDCFINGFENGRSIEMARKLGLQEEDIWIV